MESAQSGQSANQSPQHPHNPHAPIEGACLRIRPVVREGVADNGGWLWPHHLPATRPLS